MKTTNYTSDLTNKQYEKIAAHFSQKKKTAPQTVNRHEIINGILYRLKNGCSWQNLPKDFPNYKTVFHYSNLWIKEGVWDIILDELKVENRIVKKKALPTLLICDSQAVKNTDTADIETKGFCHYKSTNGIKRHLCVDVLGTPFFVVCTPANVSDDKGFIQMVTENIDFFTSLPLLSEESPFTRLCCITFSSRRA